MDYDYRHAKHIMQVGNELTIGHQIYISMKLSKLKECVAFLENEQAKAEPGQPRPSLVFCNGIHEVRLWIKQEDL